MSIGDTIIFELGKKTNGKPLSKLTEDYLNQQ